MTSSVDRTTTGSLWETTWVPTWTVFVVRQYAQYDVCRTRLLTVLGQRGTWHDGTWVLGAIGSLDLNPDLDPVESLMRSGYDAESE